MRFTYKCIAIFLKVKGSILALIYTRTRKVVTLFLAREFFQGTLHREITNNLAYSMSSFVDITSELAESTERLDVFANHLTKIHKTCSQFCFPSSLLMLMFERNTTV